MKKIFLYKRIKAYLIVLLNRASQIDKLFYSICIIGLVSLLLKNISLLAGSTLCVWLYGIFYCLKKIHQRFFLLLFCSLFFLFLLGRPLVSLCLPEIYPSYFANDVQFFVFENLFIALVSLLFSFFLFEKEKKYKESSQNIFLENIFIMIFIFSCICILVESVEQLIFVLNNGYLSFYTSFSTELPTFVIQGSNLFLMSYLCIAGLIPKIKRMNFISLLFVIFSFFTLFNGRRGTFMLNIVILIAYYFYRDSITLESNRIFTKKRIIILVCLIPFIMVILNSINEIRYGKSDFNLNPVSTINEFLYKNGSSSNLIGYAKVYSESLPKNKNYAWGSLTMYLRDNSVVNTILNIPIYRANSIEQATKTNDFSAAISYVVLGERYLNGEGLGNCYIAEMYHTFGFVGVILINVIFSLLFIYLPYLLKKDYLVFAICFMGLSKIYWAPRGEALSFVFYPFNSINIVIFYCVRYIKEEWLIWRK